MAMSSEPPFEPAVDAIDEMFEGDLDAAEVHLLQSLSELRKYKQDQRREN